ncbi:TldD/PmbA family protein [Myxococcota bacterium]|nr:TldD/PmbA family protein [Myxococcota bacterium]
MHDGIEQELLTLARRGVDAATRAGAHQAEVYASAERVVKVGFARNDLDTVSTARETTLGVRVFVDGRLGFATTNRAEDLPALAAEAVQLARSSPPDPHNGLPEPIDVPATGNLVEPSLLSLGPQELARMGAELLAMVRGLRDPRVPDGQVSVDTMDLSLHDEARAVASSTGVAQAFRGALASGGIFGMALLDGQPGSFSYDGDVARHPDALWPLLDASFRRFATNCLGALGAGRGESFRGPILVPAEVISDLLVGHLVEALSADAVRQGTSPFAGRVGQRIAVPGFTLVEGGAGLPGHPLCPFDREGLPRQRIALVEDGVLQGFLYDSYEARHAGVRSTGHAGGGATSLPTVSAACLSLDPGHAPLDELRRMDRGIVVTRFSGAVDATSGDFSGVVKGGFLVERGEARPVQETTLSGNLWQALQQVSGVSVETTLLQGTQRYPALRIEDISVTAG